MMIYTQPTNRKEVVRIYDDICPTLRTAMGLGGGNVPMVVDDYEQKAYCLQGNMIGRKISNGPLGGE